MDTGKGKGKNMKIGKVKIRRGLYLYRGRKMVVEIRATKNPIKGCKWGTFNTTSGSLLAKTKTLKEAIEMASIECNY